MAENSFLRFIFLIISLLVVLFIGSSSCSNNSSQKDSETEDNSTVIVDTRPPGHPFSYEAVVKDSVVTISWINPVDNDFSHVELYRSIDLYNYPSYLIDEADEAEIWGLYLIYKGKGVKCNDDAPLIKCYNDENHIDYNAYYYYIFTYDLTGNYSSGSIIKSTHHIPILWTVISNLRNAYIQGQDGQYLGLISNEYNTNSIFNEYGTYGNSWNALSVWNTYGIYGNEIYGNYSAFNENALYPPIIYKSTGYNIVSSIAYLTTNPTKSPRIDPRSLLLYKDEF